MKKNLFVVSDLHLGGSPEAEGRPGFQMCSAAGRARLAEFIDYIADQRTSNHDIRLVLAGDIVDFLAEEEFETFTGDENLARKKLERIMERTGEVWHALANLVTSGVKLTLLLGNHDIELSLSAPRNLLLDRLGSGNVEFIYDNQAFTDGPVILSMAIAMIHGM